jgi:hypothetical protein
MSNSTRRAFLKASTPTPDRLALAGAGSGAGATPALNRRTFLQSSAGAAAGVAVVATGPKLAAAALNGATNTQPIDVIAKPSGPPPRETVMAFVRDAARGEVTVMSGTRETTYRDPALAKRMLDAAP